MGQTGGQEGVLPHPRKKKGEGGSPTFLNCRFQRGGLLSFSGERKKGRCTISRLVHEERNPEGEGMGSLIGSGARQEGGAHADPKYMIM